MGHAISWFEIPVSNMGRAKKFYDTILATELAAIPGMENYFVFPTEQNEIGGALGVLQGVTPGGDGVVVYLNGGDDLSTILSRVEGAGGTIVTPKTDIGNNFGHFAWFKDTEGNTIGLHSMG